MFIALFALLMMTLFVSVIFSSGLLLLVMMYRVGTHGMSWVCIKSWSAATFGGLPPKAPYCAGLMYCFGSLFHGLLSEYPKYKQRKYIRQSLQRAHPSDVADTLKCVSPPSARDVGLCGVPEQVFAKMNIGKSFGTILLDVTVDFAQTLLFFCRGQPFFGVLNLMGVMIQMALFVIAMARGRLAHEGSFLQVLLQSDAVMHFRSSWNAGMVVSSMYEKSYREAFGETYISMCIAIFAV